MSIQKSYWQMSIIRYKRILGFSVNGIYSTKSRVSTIIFLLIWALAVFIGAMLITQDAKVHIIDNFITNWFKFLFLFIGLGAMIGISWFRYGDYEEVKFLSSLPTDLYSIGKLKIQLFTLEIIIALLIIGTIIYPWNYSLNLGLIVLLKQMLFVMIFMKGLYIGLSLSFALERLLGKVSIFLIVACTFGIFSLIPETFYILDTSDIRQMILMSIVWIFGLVFSYHICKEMLPNYLNALLSMTENSSSVKKSDSVKKLSSLMTAIIWKDFLHYKREATSLIQILVVDILLILAFMRVGDAGRIVENIILLSIPFTFVGQVALYSIGSDGFLLQILNMVWGTLKPYYILRLVIAFVFAAIPTMITYIIIVTVISVESFSVGILLMLLAVLLINVLTAMGISIMFIQKKPIPNIPNKGTSIGGTILYYLTGMGLPIVLAFLSLGINLSYIPLGLSVYGAVHLIVGIIFGVLGYLNIDNIITD